ncbi:hypothetical protein [Mycolicibacterium komossense]|uniref:Uncharacterized protein n=1 Tax=Mycolicibacterium komossense TaxID=1779 RepID=A0ABT3CET8_9MYCO|nr:hypothetical protein [Mycolicibacterium komossense]MCV7227898.1 hypothetical protein [Mycolicibacterium komossense]
MAISGAVTTVEYLRNDPTMVRQRYAAQAVDGAVIAGVNEHGDDFVIAIEEDPEAT